MLNHLISYILLHTKPRNHLEINRCSNFYISKKDKKAYKKQFLKNKVYTKQFDNYEITTTEYYGFKLNGHKYNKELIIRRLNVCWNCYIFLFKHSLKTNLIKFKVLDMHYNYWDVIVELHKYEIHNKIYYDNFIKNVKDNNINPSNSNYLINNSKIIYTKKFKKTIRNCDKIYINDEIHQKKHNYPVLIDIKNKKFKIDSEII